MSAEIILEANMIPNKGVSNLFAYKCFLAWYICFFGANFYPECFTTNV